MQLLLQGSIRFGIRNTSRSISILDIVFCVHSRLPPPMRCGQASRAAAIHGADICRSAGCALRAIVLHCHVADSSVRVLNDHCAKIRAMRRLSYGFGGGGQPSETVNTSKPVSVTSMVCSYCGRQAVVFGDHGQPSPSCLIAACPQLIIGSMVKIMPASSFIPVFGRP